MLQEKIGSALETGIDADSQPTCFACGADNSRGLRLQFKKCEAGEMVAEWTPDPEFEGYRKIVHGGIVSTVLDEAMAKVVAASGEQALTAELRVRFRQQVPSKKMARVRGWIDSRNKRTIKTEAALTSSDGTELAHAWATFLVLKSPGNIQS
jgi:acyl-coenzyme A thioesterase PaaI-like protein